MAMYSIKYNNNYMAASVARLFSSYVFQELANNGRSPLFSRLVRELEPLGLYDSEISVGNFFDKAFNILKLKEYRNEYIYKAAIAHKVLLGTHSLHSAVMINEFRVGNCKADSVIINGTSTVYEIKSERDSLGRLENQLSSYREVFSRINVIVGKNHLQSVASSIPKEVGILILTDRYRISTIREARDSIEKINSGSIFDSIRLDEAKEVLKLNNISIPDLPNTLMSQSLRKIFMTLSPESAHQGMVKVLKATRSLASQQTFMQKLPKSIQLAALSLALAKKNQERFLNGINTNISDAIKWN